MRRSTHSLATLPVSKAAYEEIAQKLIAAGYGHVFIVRGHYPTVMAWDDESMPPPVVPREIINEEFQKGNVMIDLHGIVLVLEQEEGNKICKVCGKDDYSLDVRGEVCIVCGIKPDEEIVVKEELSKKDKNYHITETDMVDF